MGPLLGLARQRRAHGARGQDRRGRHRAAVWRRRAPPPLDASSGGEGAGLQSFRPYEWCTGRRYRCIVTAEDAGGGATDFTGWIQDLEAGPVERLATLRWYDSKREPGQVRGLYSFLEDWHGSGLLRQGRWGPAFVRTEQGCWIQAHCAQGTTNDEQAPNVRVWLPDSDQGGGGGCLAMRSGGEAVDEPGFQGPFALPKVEVPEALRAF
mmetsp:Transcript_115261/g.358937  ORF Transcript_115261/g.358937 Transcript_115261/m.358937 type:complete len:209 (+) Transcript_115261:538-1164(+)